MHDSLGHELNLIALRAGALQIAPDLGDHHRETAAGLRAGAAEAMERLRDIIGVLREDGAPPPLEASHAGVGVLVDRARASGAGVELQCTGEAGDLPGMTDKAVYRVVQESLTNVMKHAPGAAVTVRLDHNQLDVTVAVRNSPPVRDPLENRAQGGRGLIGLQERTRLAGGEFRAGVLPDGGFEVFARLPRVPGRAGAGAGTDGAAVGVPEAIPAGAPLAGASPVGSGQGPAFGGLLRATAGLRRRFVVAVGLPLGLFACLAVVMLGYYAYGAATSVLPPSAYAQLEIGAPADAVGRIASVQGNERRPFRAPARAARSHLQLLPGQCRSVRHRRRVPPVLCPRPAGRQDRADGRITPPGGSRLTSWDAEGRSTA